MNNSYDESTKFSPQVTALLTDAITGGRGGLIDNPNPWPYRSGGELSKFFRHCGYDMGSVGMNGRVPWTDDCLAEINQKNGVVGMTKVVERLLDPRDWVNKKELLVQLVNELNSVMSYDGHEVILDNAKGRYFVRSTDKASPITQEMTKRIFLEATSIHKDFERALSNANVDPEAAITSASSLIESICKAMLDEMGEAYPSNQDISHLFTKVAGKLDISPTVHAEQDVKRILGGLSNIVMGVGSLRTKLGTAHGRGKSHVSVDPAYARLAIGAASTASVFLLERFENYKKNISEI